MPLVRRAKLWMRLRRRLRRRGDPSLRSPCAGNLRRTAASLPGCCAVNRGSSRAQKAWRRLRPQLLRRRCTRRALRSMLERARIHGPSRRCRVTCRGAVGRMDHLRVRQGQSRSRALVCTAVADARGARSFSLAGGNRAAQYEGLQCKTRPRLPSSRIATESLRTSVQRPDSRRLIHQHPKSGSPQLCAPHLRTGPPRQQTGDDVRSAARHQVTLTVVPARCVPQRGARCCKALRLPQSQTLSRVAQSDATWGAVGHAAVAHTPWPRIPVAVLKERAVDGAIALQHAAVEVSKIAADAQCHRAYTGMCRLAVSCITCLAG